MQEVQSDRAGQVIKQIKGYRAYIPRKLGPDGPAIELSKELVFLLSEAERALGELKGVTTLLPDPNLFVAFYVKKEALLSAQIEGTQCTLDEVLQADKPAGKPKPVDEVVNYIAAMNYGLEAIKTLPMSLRLINEIHKKVVDKVRGREKTPGEFKRTQNWIGPEGAGFREAVYVPPPPELMLELMGDLETYYHAEDRIPPILKTAIVHSQFETIHPYLDGNGRLGRLLITFMLCEKNILSQPLLYLSLFFKEHRSRYYELLMRVRFHGEWEEWLKFFLRGVKNTSDEATKTANDILELQKADRQKIDDVLGKFKVAHPLYNLICTQPIINVTEAVKSLGCAYPTANKIVEEFVKIDILSPYSEATRNRKFQYFNYLEILRRGT